MGSPPQTKHSWPVRVGKHRRKNDHPMEFGKLQDISKVNFTLPQDHPDTIHVLQALGKPPGTALRIYIGATGWGNQEWVGKWYPPATRSSDFLQHYTHQFRTIELNTTYYRIPDPATIQRWIKYCTPGFKFCPKIPQIISHEKYLLHTETETEQFCAAIRPLGYHLGPCFLQLPPGLGIGQFPRVEHYAHHFPQDIPLAIEFRHESWFEQNPITDEAFHYLIHNHIGTVITDVAGRRDALHMRLTTPTLMLRFVGNGLHPTDFSRIDEWVQRLVKWNRLGLQEAYIFLHEPDTLDVPELANYLIEKINHQLQLDLKPPHRYAEGIQGSLF